MKHFVGFIHPDQIPAAKDQRYANACRVFGKPDFVHRYWDQRAVDEICPGDVVIFADGDQNQSVRVHTFDDSACR